MEYRQIQFCEGMEALFSDDGEGLGAAERDVKVDALCQLMQAAAFWACDRTPEKWAIALQNSFPVISVWDQDKLIGFARATSDGIFRATIWDVVIHPDYRGQGLGRKLVQTLLAHPYLSNVERIYLMTTHQQSFYQGIGFERNTSTTMVLPQSMHSTKKLSESQVPQNNLMPD